MLEKLLSPYKILDRLVVTRKSCVIVADSEILDALKQRQTSEGARMLTVDHIVSGRAFTHLPGPYFVVTSGDEHRVKRILRSSLAQSGLFPEIYGAIHDLVPMITAESDILLTGGFEAAYESLLTQPAFAIVCTPRSGSQHIAREMRNRLFGYPLEHIRPPVIDLMKSRIEGRRFGSFDFVHWLASLVRYGTENDVFGTKLISHFLSDIDTHATPSEKTLFDDFLQRLPIIYLLRGNKMMQALSRDRAKATQNYHLFDETRRDIYQKRSQDWDYNFDRISKEIRALFQEEAYLHNRIFQIVQKEQVLLTEYESMNLTEVVQFLERKLHKPAGKRSELLSTNVLRDDLTLSYADAFYKDYAERYRKGDPATHLPHRVQIDRVGFELSVLIEPDAVGKD